MYACINAYIQRASAKLNSHPNMTRSHAGTGARARTHTHTHTHTQVWHPLLYREPTDEYQQIRSKEVPFAYVEGIERYEPPHDFQEDSWEGAGATDSQIGISVF